MDQHNKLYDNMVQVVYICLKFSVLKWFKISDFRITDSLCRCHYSLL